MLYPIYVHKDEDGSASGFAPGVTGLFFAGDTIEECIIDAKSAFDAHFELLADDGNEIPKAADIDSHLDDEDCQNGFWFMVEVDTTRYEGKAQKINITLPELLILKIDNFVSEHPGYGSRSGFLAQAARKELGKEG
ncbi:type II toxin-antitoxin system HicB family antitoxin [Zooshikella marina]|uniref:Type II toxin-antitoxin system HicB family antitoxin n=1 Tax=Zooshikella ganghwensis TaxID=202772 RepID=A0A4P9VI71_9GAMM|nr:type II toxin-antitoxin system HicB family antitoxin [Zooshikella ganghwensis]MBU2708727.1 type II toxin-antitoxin system HicB family antitoxin [Zooshikella ganghwensis]RDH41877.1 type II toxin-antitoxin system HicB family antitoxin [Zooshikella ganghwensis]